MWMTSMNKYQVGKVLNSQKMASRVRQLLERGVSMQCVDAVCRDELGSLQKEMIEEAKVMYIYTTIYRVLDCCNGMPKASGSM